MRMTRTVFAVALMAIPVLSACKKKEAPPPPAAEAPAPAPPPAPTARLELGSTSGPDGRVLAARTEFGTRDSIIASLYTENTAPGTTATAKWTFQTGQTVDSTTQSIATSPAVTKFFIYKKSGWPVGKYKLDVALSSGQAASQEFEVKK